MAAFLGVFATVAQAERVEDLPQPTDYVSDYAHVLSPETIARLDSLCTQLDHSQANAQVAIVTIHTLDGADPAEFANALEDKWKMGRKGSERGVLIFLAVDDHKRRIEVGYGLEGILPDGKLGDIGREMVPDLRANDYDGAVTLAVGEVAQVIAADAKVTLTDNPVDPQQMPHQGHHSAIFGKLILLVLVLIFFGGSSIFRMLLGYGLFSSILGGRSGFGGGGFGGGGGDSGGGGFGGFGGGGFGGGGAGGDW
ncbi:MAG: TPM domain-containing protein [Terracidiphilus sp.]